jgi:hypothetical protein
MAQSVLPSSLQEDFEMPPLPSLADAGRTLRRAAAALALGGLAASSQAAGPAEFEGADLPLGERLIRQHDCGACHARRVGGDGSAIYRPNGRVSRPAALVSMVERCSTELNLQFFPEDVAAVAAVLQRDHYHFK